VTAEELFEQLLPLREVGLALGLLLAFVLGFFLARMIGD
jgi:hypothetical protein